MKRRELMLLLLGGALTTSRGLRAQQKAMPAIGLLTGGAPDPATPGPTAFRQGLRVALIRCPHCPPTSSAARST